MHKHHTDEKGRITHGKSKVAIGMRKTMFGNTVTKERGGAAKRPGNPGPNGNGMKEKKVAKMEKVRATHPTIGEQEWEGVEKSGGYRKGIARGLRTMYKANPAWARK
jgi:hypothetical protein